MWRLAVPIVGHVPKGRLVAFSWFSRCASNSAGDPSSKLPRLLVYSTTAYVTDFLKGPLESAFPGRISFTEARCSQDTARLAQGYTAICNFVNDDCDAGTLRVLAEAGVGLVLQRCMGFDRVDIEAANSMGIRVVRVPSYSPHSVAEHAVAMMMCLNRKLNLAHSRVRDGNFTLSGLVGFDMFQKTVGIVGTGQLGQMVAQKLSGFEPRILCHDVVENEVMKTKFGATYVSMKEIFAECDIVTLHAPLLPSTYHVIDAELISHAKPGMMLINAARGGLVDAQAIIEGLTSGRIGYYGMDVYEGESSLFFKDFTQLEFSQRMAKWDTTLGELRAMPNVLVTPHQAFLTREALHDIATTTVENLREWEKGDCSSDCFLSNEVKPKPA